MYIRSATEVFREDRMDESGQGFTDVTPFEEARERFQRLCDPHERQETVPIQRGAGRTLAESVHAPRDVPHYDRAAMDGYAVRAADTYGASERSPVRLTETESPLDEGEAVPVHTGSPIPDGANAVVMIEHVEKRADGLSVFDALPEGENVAPAGEDVQAGEELFEAGHRLAPADLGLIRATGIQELTVYERPRVSVLPTGEELVSESPDAGEVVETNGLVVSSLVEQWGGAASYRDVVTDDEAALAAAIEGDADHDLVVTLGGSSVGDRDLVPAVVDDLGSIHVHGVAIQPGHPVAFGTVSETPTLLLPGYPVSCLLTAVQFLRPAIAARGGWQAPTHPTVSARLDSKLRSEPGTRTFARIQLDTSGKQETAADGDTEPETGTRTAVPVRVSGAGVLSSVTAADGWVEIPEQREGIPAGETVTVQLWDWVWRP